MAVSEDDIELAVDVTGKFENSGDPYAGVTGDFDGMGISCGVLQWNIGSNSLQPLVRLADEPVVLRTMPMTGAAMWTACTSPPAEGLAIVRAWQRQNILRPSIATELKTLLGSPEMRAVQKQRIAAVAQDADSAALAWANDSGRPSRTEQEFVWFFDILTQNGGMKGIGYPEVESFLASSGGATAVNTICDWLARAPASWWGYKDCKKNAQLWRGNVPDSTLALFVLAYLRAGVSRLPAHGLVMNRKGALAVKRGYVNSTLYDFGAKF